MIMIIAAIVSIVVSTIDNTHAQYDHTYTLLYNHNHMYTNKM